MEELFKILKEIEDTSSRNKKEAILEANKENETLQKIFQYALNPYYIYGIGKKSLDAKDINLVTNKFKTIFDLLDYLRVNNGGSNGAITETLSFLTTVSPVLRDWYKRIILKDLRIGVTEKTVNKIWKDLIPEFNVQLGSKYEEKYINGDFLVMQKLDGSRLVAIKRNNSITFLSRQGKIIEGLIDIEKELIKMPVNNVVFDGEIIAINNEGLGSADLFRKTMELSRLKGIKQGLEYHIFDLIPVDEFEKGISKETTLQRKNKLVDLFKEKYVFIKQVPILYAGNNTKQISTIQNYAISKDWEGLMVQLCDSKYECKRVKTLLKVKKFHVADCRVINLFEGDGKYKNMLGGIDIQFICDEGETWVCQCGSGFSDEERINYWNNPKLLLNKIVEIGYFEISTNANGSKGLRFPTWKGIIRDDKDELSLY